MQPMLSAKYAEPSQIFKSKAEVIDYHVFISNK